MNNEPERVVQRIDSLDYLRGLSAFGIMIYHFNSWNGSLSDSNQILSRFGIYGVSIFYILSGLTLIIVYKDNLRGKLQAFYIKRIFRLMPLLWVSIGFTYVAMKVKPSLYELVLNITGAFSVLGPSDYIAGGSWSIGNEIFFYLIFPILLLAFRRSYLIGLLTIIVCYIHYFFAYEVMDRNLPFIDNWERYVNPLNQVIFFFAGLLSGYFFAEKKMNRILAVCIFLVSISVFAFYKTNPAKIFLIIGGNRLLFSLASIALVLAIFNMRVNLEGYLHRTFKWLGEISYSLYLLHPIVWGGVGMFVNYAFGSVDTSMQMLISIPLVLIISHLMYFYFEKKMVKVGRKFV